MSLPWTMSVSWPFYVAPGLCVCAGEKDSGRRLASNQDLLLQTQRVLYSLVLLLEGATEGGSQIKGLWQLWGYTRHADGSMDIRTSYTLDEFNAEPVRTRVPLEGSLGAAIASTHQGPDPDAINTIIAGFTGETVRPMASTAHSATLSMPPTAPQAAAASPATALPASAAATPKDYVLGGAAVYFEEGPQQEIGVGGCTFCFVSRWQPSLS
jgi:hypothetical protein